MDKKIFNAGVKSTATDFNDLHENTEVAIGDLVKALASAGNTSYVLFENKPPTIAGAGPYQITVPAQYIAVNGVVAKIAQSVITLSAGQFPNKLWFKISYNNVTATRDTLTAAGQTVVVEKVATASIETGNTQPDSQPENVLDSSGNPTLPFLYASYDGSRVLTFDSNNYRWTVAAAGIATHASTHLSGGTDALPVASSIVSQGLVDWPSLQAARDAVTAVNVSVASPFLTSSTSGSYNTVPKESTLALSVDTDTFNPASTLGLKFANGPLAGISKQPARYDHRHGLDASPVAVYQTEVVIDVTHPLGTAKTVTLPSTAGTVASVSIFWKPASALSTTNYPLVPTFPQAVEYGSSIYNVGSWGTLLSGNTIRINFGLQGLCFLSENDFKTASGIFGGVTWQTAASANGRVPTSGILVVRVTAVRDYVTPLTI